MLVFLSAALSLLFLFRATGTIRFREYLKGVQERLGEAGSRAGKRRTLDRLRLRINEAKYFHQWWRVVRLAGREIGLQGLRVRAENSDGTAEQRCWIRTSGRNDLREFDFSFPSVDGAGTIHMKLYLDPGISVGVAGEMLVVFGSLLEDPVPIADRARSGSGRDANASLA